MQFTFPHSHAFPGGRVVIEDDGNGGPSGLVEFGDGVTVISEWRLAGDVIYLIIPAYRTGRGTEVAARNWIVAQRKSGEWRSQPPP